MSSMNYHEILHVNKSRWILFKYINPHHLFIDNYSDIFIVLQKILLNSKKFWRQKLLKMVMGD